MIIRFAANSLRLLALGLLALSFAVQAGKAQFPDGLMIEKQTPLIKGYESRSADLQRAFASNRDDDVALVDIRVELDELEKEILATAVAFRPRMTEINGRLDQIGPPPPDGTVVEPDLVRQERIMLLEEKAKINALIGESETLSLKVNKLIEEIGVRRRALFAQSLSKRYEINPSVLRNAIAEFGDEVAELWYRLSSWFKFIINHKLPALLSATFAVMAGAGLLLFISRNVAVRARASYAPDHLPSFLERVSVAFWATFLPTVILAVMLFVALRFYYDYGLFREDLGTILLSIINVIVVVYLVHRLALFILAPWRPAWRLVGFDDTPSQRLYWLVVATAAATGLDVIMSTVNDVLSSPLNLTVAKAMVITVIVAVLILMIANTSPTADDDGVARPWPAAIRYLLYAVGMVPLIATFLGYVGLARFALQQIVVTGAILVTMYIGFLAAREITAENAFMRTVNGQWLKKRLNLSDLTIEQIGVVSGIATNLLVLLIGVPLILLQWGFQWGDIKTWALEVLDGFQVGSISISIYGIFSGIIVFVIAYVLTRWFQRWLDGTVMSRSKMDSGVRNSIRTAVGYAGFVVALLIGISAAGIELQNLALIAGGLSLGIGFGLQNIVSNFVSGLILLAERPFKAGDWIVAGNVSGFVKKISVRATEIETFQRQTVILPNSELINAAVGNWTHRNRLARIEIAVGVEYGSDAKRVRSILLQIANDNPQVLKNPEPVVVFSNFGDSSLDFELRVFLNDVFDMNEVQTDIRFAILDAFAAEGIGIPFPQRDINIKGGTAIAAEAPAKAPRKPATGKTSSKTRRPAARK